MAKYKPQNKKQGLFAAIYLEDQIQPGTFEHTLQHHVDHELDTSFFDDRYRNDETGAPAYDPKVLLKIILFAYSRGITSSRKIAQCCKENVTFMALSSNSKPHFTTIADFVSSMDAKAIKLFREVLLLCDEMGLIGKEMFAIDGCAAKEKSGTLADFQKRATKMEKAIEKMVDQHRKDDFKQLPDSLQAREKKSINTIRNKLAKIRNWLDDNDDKTGSSGKPIKSNMTDNDSAKMKTSHGYVQGYDGVSTVDSKHQVIVHAEAFGQAQEHNLLKPMVDGTRENFCEIGEEDNIFDQAKLAVDAGFHSEANMKMLFSQKIDAYVADNQFRKRDPRFADYDRYKNRIKKKGLFSVKDFVFPPDLSHCLCPAGKRLYRSGHKVRIKNYLVTKFQAPQSACVPCQLRSQCLRYPERTQVRQVAYFHGKNMHGQSTFTEKMKKKIDSTAGRLIYSLRVGVVEPPFSHICHVMGLNRFSHRGKKKVNTQWNLFTIVHNMKKIHRYGLELA